MQQRLNDQNVDTFWHSRHLHVVMVTDWKAGPSQFLDHIHVILHMVILSQFNFSFLAFSIYRWKSRYLHVVVLVTDWEAGPSHFVQQLPFSQHLNAVPPLFNIATTPYHVRVLLRPGCNVQVCPRITLLSSRLLFAHLATWAVHSGGGVERGEDEEKVGEAGRVPQQR